MRYLLLLILFITLPCYAQTYDVGYIFNPSITEGHSVPDYEYQKGYFDHVETIDYYMDGHYYFLLMIPKNNKMDKSLIPYGKNYKELRKDYKLNNDLMYKDKSIIGKIKHKLNEKKWDNANILNYDPPSWEQ